MKTPIPRPNALDSRVANLERLVAALVDLASPDQLRKAIAAGNSRTALAEISAAVEAGVLVTASNVSDMTVAVRFMEMRGEEIATPAVIVQLAALAEDARAMFMGKGIGDDVSNVNGTRAVVDQVWDRVPPKRMHKPPKGRRHGRR